MNGFGFGHPPGQQDLMFVCHQDLDFRKATKTKSIKVKPLVNLMADQTILAKFLLDTLEGSQVLRASSMVCLGISNDVWQQPAKKLLAKYTVIDVDDQGWMTCVPKPDNEVLAAEIGEDLCGQDGKFSIAAQWGEERVIDGKQLFVQHGVAGDYVLQSLSDLHDHWIVKCGFFNSTYDWKKDVD